MGSARVVLWIMQDLSWLLSLAGMYAPGLTGCGWLCGVLGGDGWIVGYIMGYGTRGWLGGFRLFTFGLFMCYHSMVWMSGNKALMSWIVAPFEVIPGYNGTLYKFLSILKWKIYRE